MSGPLIALHHETWHVLSAYYQINSAFAVLLAGKSSNIGWNVLNCFHFFYLPLELFPRLLHEFY